MNNIGAGTCTKTLQNSLPVHVVNLVNRLRSIVRINPGEFTRTLPVLLLRRSIFIPGYHAVAKCQSTVDSDKPAIPINGNCAKMPLHHHDPGNRDTVFP